MKLRLREIREKNDLSGRQMAIKMKVGKTTYNYYELGKRIITVEKLNRFCNIFSCSMDYTLGLTEFNIVPKKKYQINRELVGQRLKEIRKENNLSQELVADILNTSQSTISEYENGHTLIITAFLYELAKKLNVSADYLIGRSNTKKIYIKNK